MSIATGAIAEDNTIFEFYVGGKIIEGVAFSFKFYEQADGKLMGFQYQKVLNIAQKPDLIFIN